MNLHHVAVRQPKKMLQNLSRWLDKAAAYVGDRKAEPDDFLTCRLAIDMYPLVKQVQSACDTAKFMPARLGDLEAPKHPDDEKTFDEIKKRVDETVAFLESVDPSAVEGAEDKKITLPFLPEGKWARGEDYVVEFGLPNFYFHLAMAYAILRHNGVPVGKTDYIGSFELQG